MIKRLLFLAVLVSALVLAGGVSADNGGSTDGCVPGLGWVGISVAEAASAGYAPVPAIVDEAGNNDGYVCRRALGDGTWNWFIRFCCPVDKTLYLWSDNEMVGNNE